MNLVTLTMTPETFALLWRCIGKQPAEVVFAMMQDFQQQVKAQEQEAQRGANRQE